MCRFDRFRRVARGLVENSDCHTAMAAIIVKGGKTIAVGWNKSGYYGRSIHAEEDALKQLRYQKCGPDGADIHVFRFGASGEERTSKPCKNCFEMIRNAKIRRIFFTDISSETSVVKVDNSESGDFYEVSKKRIARHK